MVKTFGKSILVFLGTLIIGYLSMLLSILVTGVLFFGRYAIVPVESAPSFRNIIFIIQFIIVLLFGITFIRFFQHKFGGRIGVFVGGALALAIITIIFLGLMSFSVN